MKRNRLYEVNVLNNTVVVSRRFLDAASQINSKEYRLYRQFEEMGLKIIVETRSAGRKKSSPLRPLNGSEESRKPLISLEKMALYISMLDDADVMMDEFDAVRRAARSMEHPRRYINDWFRNEFPHYDDIPEIDDDNRIVHNPNAA